MTNLLKKVKIRSIIHSLSLDPIINERTDFYHVLSSTRLTLEQQEVFIPTKNNTD